MLAILKAAWRTFDAAVEAAHGKELRKGPRGGGRDAVEIVRHMVDADGGYLGRIGARLDAPASLDPAQRLRLARAAILEALPNAAAGNVTAVGPRGGVRWTARTFVRRLTWHIRSAEIDTAGLVRCGFPTASDLVKLTGRSIAPARRVSICDQAVVLRFRALQRRLQLLAADQTKPLPELFAGSVEQEHVGLDPVAKLPLEVVIARVIDVKIDEVDVLAVLLFEPMHDGRQSLAGRSPEGEELHQRRLAGGQVHRRRVGRFLSAAQRRGRRW
jgi:hypothetical protein